MIYRHQHPAFTLIELLLYVVTSALIIGAISGLVWLSLQGRVKRQAITEVEEQGRQAVQIITQSIRNATGVTSPVVGTMGATLSLSTSQTSTNPTVFNTTSNAIQMTEGLSAASPLNTAAVKVTNLQFTNLSTTLTKNVRLTFTVESNGLSNRSDYNFQDTFTADAQIRP